MADATQYYQQALTAEADGRRSDAIRLLSRAVEANNDYLDAWVKLAELMPDGDDKYDVLEQIIALDPDNPFALGEWDRLERNDPQPQSRQQARKSNADEVVPGITRGEARIVSIGLGLYTGVMILLTILVIAIARTREDQSDAQTAAMIQQQTEFVQRLAQNRTATADMLLNTQIVVQQTAASTQTAAALQTLTPITRTPTPDTRTATPTPQLLRVAPAVPADADISGQVLTWAGINSQSPTFLPMRLYDFGVPQPVRNATRFTNFFVQNIHSDVDRTRLVGRVIDLREREEAFFTITEQTLIDPPLDLTTIWGDTALDPAEPVLAADGTAMVFVATAANRTREVFWYVFETQELTQLTDDGNDYLEAAIASDSTQVVAVQQGIAGADLIAIDLVDPRYPIRSLTRDGGQRIEGHPRFAHDNQQLVYTVASPINPDNRNIFTLDLQTFVATALIEGESDEAFPAFSPDDRYIAYSSNANGVYNVFIYDRTDDTRYQLTAQNLEPIYVASWVQR
jgi:hypothetical protein